MDRRKFMTNIRSSISSNGLMSYYKFNSSTKDEITGVTNSASLSYSTGKIGNAGYFGSYTPLKYSKSSGRYYNFSLNMWTKLDSSGQSAWYRGLFVSRASDESNQYGLSWDVDPRVLVIYYNATRTYTCSIPLGSWIMLTLTIDNGTGYLYINGSRSSSFNFPYFAIQECTYIGCDYLPVTTSQKDRGLCGYIDELSVWNKTLSSYEVSSLYNNGKGLEL